MKIAVVGAGLFGCIAALKLDQFGHSVTLFESAPEIMLGASGVNQYRLHSGYHYPRSIETARQSYLALRSFKKEYGDCLAFSWIDHYYGIAAGSKISTHDYLKFLHELELPYKIIDSKESGPFADISKFQSIFKVQEDTIDIKKLKDKISDQLNRSGIILKLGETFTPGRVQEYEIVINAAYANSNYLLPPDQRVDYQFEVCEKPIVKLNKTFENKSIVVIDGNFGCIDPFTPMNNHVLGHVRHAIHSTSVGHFPVVPDHLKSLLFNTCFATNEHSNIGLIAGHLHQFFPSFVDGFQYVGSMFTIRTVLPGREFDDARPSYITKHSDNLYSIFSGKLGTAVDIADELVNIIHLEHD